MEKIAINKSDTPKCILKFSYIYEGIEVSRATEAYKPIKVSSRTFVRINASKPTIYNM